MTVILFKKRYIAFATGTKEPFATYAKVSDAYTALEEMLADEIMWWCLGQFFVKV